MTDFFKITAPPLFFERMGEKSTPFPINGLTGFFPEMTQSLGIMKTQPLCFFLVLGERTFHSMQFMNFKNHEPCLTFWKHTNILLYGSCSEGKCSSDLHANSKEAFSDCLCSQLAGGCRPRTGSSVWTYGWVERAGAEVTNHQRPEQLCPGKQPNC